MHRTAPSGAYLVSGSVHLPARIRALHGTPPACTSVLLVLRVALIVLSVLGGLLGRQLRLSLEAGLILMTHPPWRGAHRP